VVVASQEGGRAINCYYGEVSGILDRQQPHRPLSTWTVGGQSDGGHTPRASRYLAEETHNRFASSYTWSLRFGGDFQQCEKI